MLHFARRLALLSAIAMAFSSVSLPGQSQPASPAQSTPANPTPLPQQAAPPPSPAAPQPPAQQPGTLPEQSAPPASASPQQSPTRPDQAQPTQPAAAPSETTPQPAPSANPPKTPKAAKKDNDKPINQADIHNASLWQDPGNISAKDMFYGEGGAEGQPIAPFKFIAEDTNGTNPKFDVKDAKNRKWRVKLAEEARPEVVASRILWAIGYYVNDDYLLHVATVQGLNINRGSKLVHNGNQVIDARFERKADNNTKIATWDWKNNPFHDTREFNGLRVMMAVVNNWDLKDANNAVYTNKQTGNQTFLVSDIGATFATNALQTTRAQDKGNVDNYVNSKFITKTTPTTVDFGTPGAPTGVLIKSVGFLAGDYAKRRGYDWIGQDIPRQDARWIGSLLGQLSHEQLADAFRAGNFPPESINQYVSVLESRIAQLKAL